MHILIVDPNALSRRVMRAYLTQSRYTVSETGDGRAVWELLRHTPVDVLISAWPLPGSNGVELLRRMRAATDLAYTYVVLTGGPTSGDDLIAGLQAGADDYLVKPLNLKELRRRVILGARIAALEGRMQQFQHERERLLAHDSLTGLFTRQAIAERAEAALTQARSAGQSFSLMLIKLQQLAAINTTHGYHSGNQALRLLADTTVQTVRQYDSVGRWSGTRLLLALPGTTATTADSIAERVRRRIDAAEMVLPDGATVRLHAIIGCASACPNHRTTLAQLVQGASAIL